MGEIHLDRIKRTPVFVLYDPSKTTAACTTASHIKTMESQIATLQKTYTYTMKSNRIDRFVADDSFVYQLAFSLNAETKVAAAPEPEPETKPEKGSTKQSKPATPSNSTETKGDDDTVNIEL